MKKIILLFALSILQFFNLKAADKFESDYYDLANLVYEFLSENVEKINTTKKVNFFREASKFASPIRQSIAFENLFGKLCDERCKKSKNACILYLIAQDILSKGTIIFLNIAEGEMKEEVIEEIILEIKRIRANQDEDCCVIL